MSKKLFDFLRILQIIIPLCGTLYAAAAATWGWPYGEQITATCTALMAFLAGILKIESDDYFSDKQIIEAPENENAD